MSNKQRRPATVRLRSAKCVTKSKEELKETKYKQSEKQKASLSELIKKEVVESKRRHMILEGFPETNKMLTPSCKLNKVAIGKKISQMDKDKFLQSVLLNKDKLLKSRKMDIADNRPAKMNDLVNKRQMSAPSKIDNEKLQIKKNTFSYQEQQLKKLQVEKDLLQSSLNARLRKAKIEESNKSRNPFRKNQLSKRFEKLAKKSTTAERPARETRVKKSFEMSKPVTVCSSDELISPKFDVRIEKINRTMNTDSIEESGEGFLGEIDLQTCSKCAKEAIPENILRQSIQMKQITSSVLFMDGVKTLSDVIMRELQGNTKRKIKIITIDDDENNGDDKKVLLEPTKKSDGGVCRNIHIAGKGCVKENRTLIKEMMRENMQETDFITFNDVSSKAIEKIYGNDKKDEVSQLPIKQSHESITPTDTNRLSIMSESTRCESEETEMRGSRSHACTEDNKEEYTTIKKNPLSYYITLNCTDSIEEICINQHETEQSVQENINKIQSCIEKSMNANNKFPVKKEQTPIGDQITGQGEARKQEKEDSNKQNPITVHISKSSQKIKEIHANNSAAVQSKSNQLNSNPNKASSINQPRHSFRKNRKGEHRKSLNLDKSLAKKSFNSKQTKSENKQKQTEKNVGTPISLVKLNRNSEKINSGRSRRSKNKTENRNSNSSNQSRYSEETERTNVENLQRHLEQCKAETLQQNLEQTKVESLQQDLKENEEKRLQQDLQQNQMKSLQQDLKQTAMVPSVSKQPLAQTSENSGEIDNASAVNVDNVSSSSSRPKLREEKVHPFFLIAVKLSKISEHLETLLQEGNSTPLSRLNERKYSPCRLPCENNNNVDFVEINK